MPVQPATKAPQGGSPEYGGPQRLALQIGVSNANGVNLDIQQLRRALLASFSSILSGISELIQPFLPPVHFYEPGEAIFGCKFQVLTSMV